MRKFTLMIVVICLLFTSLTFARVYDGKEKIYLRPSAVSWWLNDNAKVGLFFTDGTNVTFVEALWLVDNDGGNIYSATVPYGTWTHVIVTRHPRSSPMTWENAWNKTGNISIDATANYIQSFSENLTEATWQTLKAHYRSKASGNWNTASNWESSPDNTNWVTSTLVPGSSASSITILTGHNITLDNNVTIPGLTINSGATFTASDATARTLTITKSTSGSTTTLTNSGTWSNGTGESTVVFTGAPSSGDAIHAITGTIPFQKVISRPLKSP